MQKIGTCSCSFYFNLNKQTTLLVLRVVGSLSTINILSSIESSFIAAHGAVACKLGAFVESEEHVDVFLAEVRGDYRDPDVEVALIVAADGA